MSDYSTEALAAARDYFRQPEPQFWTWGDDAIGWTKGTTIVFYQELADILRRLAIDGLPRFSPLLLLLAACRESYRRERIERVLSQEKALLTATISGLGLASSELLDSLDMINRLPKELRSSVDAKVALIETVFQGRRFFPAEYAVATLELLKSIPASELLGCATTASEDTQIWAKEELLGAPGEMWPHVSSALLVMRAGLNRIDEAALRLRLRTGLDRLPKPAEIEPPPAESLRAFVSRLRHDPELSGLGRLAHDLMAAVQVPRGVSEPEDLQLGGVSDIANRGPLDRLLVSELAHDDLTLAVRVAVGEALYLRREAPPRTPVRQRHLLIDCGIRLWGVPRVFAAATGLALAATADRHTEVAAWRATAHGIEPIEFGTREGLVDLLEQLEASPHPATAVTRFFDTLEGASTEADAILITHEDVLTDRDFVRAMADAVERPFYIVTVDRDGRFRLIARSGRGSKTIREAQFDLDRLLAPGNRPTAPLIRPDAGSDLPAILSVKPFPLLLPHQVNLDRMAYHPAYGAVTVAHDGRLMHWRHPGQAALEIAASVPPGEVRHISIDDEGVLRLVAGGQPNVPLVLLWVKLASGQRGRMTIDPTVHPSSSVVYYQNALFFIWNDSIRVVNDRGDVSPPCATTRRHKGGRFFSWGKQAWYALSFDGQTPQLTRLPLHKSVNPSTVIAMFDMRGHDGPWAITDAGLVIGATNGVVLWHGWGAKAELVKVSDCGRHLIVRLPASQANDHLSRTYRLSLNPGGSPVFTLCGKNAVPAMLADPALGSLLCGGSLRHRFQQIGVNAERRLTLVSRKDHAITIGPGLNSSQPVIESCDGMEFTRVQSFQPTEGLPDVRYVMRVARWADGSRAWIDSRGLLHLKSSDRALPELTIVLVHSGEVAAWASDGRIWGRTFYTGHANVEARLGEDLLAAIDAFVTRLQ